MTRNLGDGRRIVPAGLRFGPGLLAANEGSVLGAMVCDVLKNHAGGHNAFVKTPDPQKARECALILRINAHSRRNSAFGRGSP